MAPRLFWWPTLHSERASSSSTTRTCPSCAAKCKGRLPSLSSMFTSAWNSSRVCKVSRKPSLAASWMTAKPVLSLRLGLAPLLSSRRAISGLPSFITYERQRRVGCRGWGFAPALPPVLASHPCLSSEPNSHFKQAEETRCKTNDTPEHPVFNVFVTELGEIVQDVITPVVIALCLGKLMPEIAQNGI